MGIISWIILGLIAGFVGSKIVDRQGQGFMPSYCGPLTFDIATDGVTKVAPASVAEIFQNGCPGLIT